MAKLIIWELRILPNGLTGVVHVVGMHVACMLQLKEQQIIILILARLVKGVERDTTVHRSTWNQTMYVLHGLLFCVHL